MGTIWYRDFRGGLDTRRLPETSPGGALIVARDCHITSGGEIEQRADFVKVYDLPAGLTHGLATSPDGLTVFGHPASVAGVPAGLVYQQLAHPAGEALANVPYATLFRGEVQAIGEYVDGSRYVFSDGVLVTDVLGPPYASGSGKPNTLLTANEKLHIGSGPNLFFSAIQAPTDFGSGGGTGEGVIVMSTHAEGAQTVTGLAPYGEFVAVFSRRVVLVWYLEADPALSRRAQILVNTGAVAARAITQFGDGDVFYLDRSGVRSLRARDSSNSAATTDVGSPVDTDVSALLTQLGDTEAAKAVSVIEPRSGRFWLAIGDRIFVFSFFQSAQISAWSEYRPGFTVDDMVVHDEKVWIRSGDAVYVYGGTGAQFSYSAAARSEVWLPFSDADQPFRQKTLDGIDAAVRGSWEIRAGMDPTNPSTSDAVARVTRTTFGEERIDADGQFNHISLRFIALAPASPTSPAKIGSAVVHFDRDRTEDS